MQDEKFIGVIGGMGPYAGVDLVQKIFDHTLAVRDQEHLSVALLSAPVTIPDRSEYLYGRTSLNPAVPIAELLGILSRMGAEVAGIPCNTAHAPLIFDEIERILKHDRIPIRVLHIVEETVRFIREFHPEVRRVGVLSTSSSMRERIFCNVLEKKGLESVRPDADVQEEHVNQAIFNEEWGIKAQSDPVSNRAREELVGAVNHLVRKGAEVVILGCTELPLAITERKLAGNPMIDSTLVLARSLIREVSPDKLRTL